MDRIHPDVTVRELLTTCPQAFDVLLAHGMCEDCREDPPPVPLRHFARKHCQGNVDGLLTEIRAATGIPD
jgi:hypothetical protein